MTEESWAKGPPKRILMATDLSARCDRALDRALALADQWGAELVAVHALEPAYRDELERRLPSWRRDDPAAIVAAQFRHDLAGHKVTTVVERGDPAEIVLRVAEERHCDLIVTGLARDETLGRFGLGATVNRLLRRSRVPLLIVKERPRAPYSQILVATDFSESSRQALRAAIAFFPDRKISLFNAYEPPMAGMSADAATYREEYRSVILAESERFLAETGVPDYGRRRFELLAEPGEPVGLIQQYVADRSVDLVVLGTHGRSGVLDIILGSTARDILSALPCDALVVREPRARLESD